MSGADYEIQIDVGELSEKLSRRGWRPVAEMVNDPNNTIESVLRHCEAVGAVGAATILRDTLAEAREQQALADRPFVAPTTYVVYNSSAYWLMEGGGLEFTFVDPETGEVKWEDGGEGEVDFLRAFRDDAEAAPYRAIEAALKAIAATQPSTDDEPSP
jgi:hypothetical protein